MTKYVSMIIITLVGGWQPLQRPRTGWFRPIVSLTLRRGTRGAVNFRRRIQIAQCGMATCLDGSTMRRQSAGRASLLQITLCWLLTEDSGRRLPNERRNMESTMAMGMRCRSSTLPPSSPCRRLVRQHRWYAVSNRPRVALMLQTGSDI